MTCGHGFGSLMMLHERGELRTDFRPLRLTVTYQATCQRQGQGHRQTPDRRAGRRRPCRRDRRSRGALAMTAGKGIAVLPHARRDRDELTRHFGGRRPAVFLDYDGTLTPIVDRPEDAVISVSMRRAVRGLARCPVCVVSGRERRVVQDLIGVEDLIVAGSHGFDIWSPTQSTLEHEAGGGFEELIERVTERVRQEADPIEGSLVEPKKASVALHYRLVAGADRPAIEAIVDRVLAEHRW